MRNAAFILSMLSITASSWAQTPPPAANDPQDNQRGERREQSMHKREEMKQHFAEQFKKADTNGDGALSRAEAEKGMPKLAKHFDEIDANKDGKITPDEIKARMQARHEQKREQHQQKFEEHFKKADTDGDGALSRAEAEKGMPRLAKHFDEIDANKDGKITQDELKAHMKARMEQHQRGDKAQ